MRLIEALAETGVTKIDCVSFVSPKRVPQMADAEEVAAAIRKRPGVAYTGLWLNAAGLERAMATPLDILGAIRINASEQFSIHNTGMDHARTHEEQRQWLARYREAGVPTKWGYVMAAFGCNYQGDVPVADVVDRVAEILDLAEEFGVTLDSVFLADTMGYANPAAMERVLGAVRSRWPDAGARPAPARHAGPRHRQRPRGAADGRRPVRLDLRRASAAARSPDTKGRQATCAARSWSSSARSWASRRASTSTPSSSAPGWPRRSSATPCRAP